MSSLKSDILAYAHSLGFSQVGITTAEALQADEKALGQWIAKGYAGEMDYMVKDWQTRARPGERLPGAKSVICLAVSYHREASPPTPPCPPLQEPRALQEESRSRAGLPMGEGRLRKDPLPSGEGGTPGVWGVGEAPHEGRIARYASGKDYHKVLAKRLQSLVRYIEALAPDAHCKSYVDTGPMLERSLAQRSGLGFVGKNTVLITRGSGSWVFLASVVTTLELPVDGSDTRTCGSCTLCIDACPTQALTEPFQLDARRCISYLTIEARGPVPDPLRPQIGNWLFGCDICQEVCPHNARRAAPGAPSLFREAEHPELTLAEILSLKSDAEFDRRLGGTSLKRARREGLVRNACLVAANQNRTDLLPQLNELAENDPHPVVREQARWSVSHLRESRPVRS